MHTPTTTATSSRFSLGIRGRLLMGFALVAIAIIIVSSYILFLEQRTERYTDNIINIELPLYEELLDLNGKISNAQYLTYSFLALRSDEIKKQLMVTRSQVDTLLKQIDDLKASSQNKLLTTQLPVVSDLIYQLRNNQDKILALDTGATQTDLLAANQTIFNKLLDVVDGQLDSRGERNGGIFGEQHKLVEVGTLHIKSDLRTIRYAQYTLLAVIILISILIAFLTARRIVKPLQRAINISKDIAAGERNINIVVDSNDETGDLLQNLKTMQNAIRENEEKIRLSESKSRKLFDDIVQTANVFSTHSSKVAGGDFRNRLEVSKEDLMKQLGSDLNLMTESLATITKQITESSQNMVVSLEEVKQAVDMQSSGASEQASSINEITASLEEIEKSTSQTMEKAKALGEAATRTQEKGQMGLVAVEQSINGMKSVRDKVQMIAQTILDLSNQTQQVGEITAVVNSLAQQSKMLALNASIEAAKAGEAGKGFAVVAAEVKNLAQQSEESTTQVQKILEDIKFATEKAVMVTEEGTKGVDQGTGLVEETGIIVKNLSEVIHETTIASQQIEAAVRQESIGIEQITVGMNEINQVTASFVASAKQTMEAIENLAVIAKNLKQRVDTYKI